MCVSITTPLESELYETLYITSEIEIFTEKFGLSWHFLMVDNAIASITYRNKREHIN